MNRIAWHKQVVSEGRGRANSCFKKWKTTQN